MNGTELTRREIGLQIHQAETSISESRSGLYDLVRETPPDEDAISQKRAQISDALTRRNTLHHQLQAAKLERVARGCLDYGGWMR